MVSTVAEESHHFLTVADHKVESCTIVFSDQRHTFPRVERQFGAKSVQVELFTFDWIWLTKTSCFAKGIVTCITCWTPSFSADFDEFIDLFLLGACKG